MLPNDATDIFSTLPTEILQEIFSALIQSTANQLSLIGLEFHRLSTVKHLKQLTHEQLAICGTCSSWRVTAINYPPLWTCVALYSGPWALECLNRSKGLPVALFGARRWVNELDKHADIFMSQPGRIKQIAFFDEAKSLNKWIPLCPTLEVLHLGTPGNVFLFSDVPEALDISTLFSLPNLRQLGVSDHWVNWEMTHPLQATRLTSLSLKHTHPTGTFKLFSILQQTPALESLAITESYAGAREFFTPHQVHLAHLVVLRLDAHLHRCVDALLPYLRYPPSTMLHITVGTWNFENPSLDGPRVSELLRLCGLNDAPTARQIDIRFEPTSKDRATLAIWDNIPGCSPVDDHDVARVTIRFVHTWSMSVLPRQILPHISAPNVERLLWTSEHPSVVAHNELCQLFHGMPNVTELVMSGCLTIRPYTSLFDQLAHPADEQRARPLYLPSLVRLELSGVDFTMLKNHLREVDVLEGMLAHRKKYGAGIGLLCLRNCACIGKEVVDKLERAQVAQEVVWDGRSNREWVEI